VLPPSPVFRMVLPRVELALEPTATHVLVLGQLTPLRIWSVPEVWTAQVAPAVVVARIVPTSPTPKQVLALGQLTPKRGLPWGSGFCQTHMPPPVLTRATTERGNHPEANTVMHRASASTTAIVLRLATRSGVIAGLTPLGAWTLRDSLAPKTVRLQADPSLLSATGILPVLCLVNRPMSKCRPAAVDQQLALLIPA
jgi:hypothetical protein